jgi:hypothetical protein
MIPDRGDPLVKIGGEPSVPAKTCEKLAGTFLSQWGLYYAAFRDQYLQNGQLVTHSGVPCARTAPASA